MFRMLGFLSAAIVLELIALVASAVPIWQVTKWLGHPESFAAVSAVWFARGLIGRFCEWLTDQLLARG